MSASATTPSHDRGDAIVTWQAPRIARTEIRPESRPFFERPRRSGTIVDSDAIDTNELIAPAPPRAHEVDASFVDAVVSELSSDNFTLRCLDANNALVEFPLTLLPEESRFFGAPVRLSLNQRKGFRMPLIETRARRALPHSVQIDEIDAWINSI